MPIIRYFVFVGGLLLALLFAANRYLSAPIETAAAADPDRTIIRIKSARSFPEKIVFDTDQRAAVPIIAQADPVPEEPERQVREAMAAMAAAPSVEFRRKLLFALGSRPPACETLGKAAEKAARPTSRLRAGPSICRRLVVTECWRVVQSRRPRLGVRPS